jgi:hypothetical protein
MPKRESYYLKIMKDKLKGVEPIKFSLDGPSKKQVIMLPSLHTNITVTFRFIRLIKKIGAVKFSITQKTKTHASKETIIRRIQVFHRDSYPLDKYITVIAFVDEKYNLFKLKFIPNPNV